MTDLLTHVLVGYVLGTLLSMRYGWLSPQLVTVVMLGALVPDVSKIDLLIPGWQVEMLLGVSFEWRALHMLGGTLVAIIVGALFTSTRHRRRVFLLLAVGAASHHLLDALLLNVSGFSYPIFWPLTTYHPPTLGLYLSSDRWPAAVAAIAAIVVWYLRTTESAQQRPDQR